VNPAQPHALDTTCFCCLSEASFAAGAVRQTAPLVFLPARAEERSGAALLAAEILLQRGALRHVRLVALSRSL
jgi:hypothetical protein